VRFFQFSIKTCLKNTAIYGTNINRQDFYVCIRNAPRGEFRFKSKNFDF